MRVKALWKKIRLAYLDYKQRKAKDQMAPVLLALSEASSNNLE